MGVSRSTPALAILGAIIIVSAALIYNRVPNQTLLNPVLNDPIPASTVSKIVSATVTDTPAPTAPTQRPRNLEEMKKIAKWDSSSPDFIDKKWKIALNLAAVPSHEDSKIKKGFLFSHQGLDLFESENSLSDHLGSPVVFFPERNRLGYISGTLTIRLADRDLKDKITLQYGLKVEHYFETISTLIVRTENFKEMVDLRAKLIKDDRIKTIEVEIVENNLERQ